MAYFKVQAVVINEGNISEQVKADSTMEAFNRFLDFKKIEINRITEIIIEMVCL